GDLMIFEEDSRPSGLTKSLNHQITKSQLQYELSPLIPRLTSNHMAFFSRSTQPAAAVNPAETESLAPNTLIGLRNIEKSYAHGTSRSYVLRRINADIKEGEFVSIMGPSGAGKSTLLHIIGMHDSAWTGEFYCLDQPVHKLDKNKRSDLRNKNIGFVFQSYHLLDSLTVFENLDIPLSYRNVKKAERQSMVCDVLDRFQIVAKKDLFPNQLSGG